MGLGLQDVEHLHFYAGIEEFTMSVAIYPNVLDLDMDGRRKLVLVVLADHANEDGLCWPSQALLARRASISIRKLRVHLRGLESDGWLKTYVNKGPREVNYYLLHVAKIAEAAKLTRQRITEEKERKRVKFSDVEFVTPDFPSTTPDLEDIPPDLQDITPDFQDIPPGPQLPTEPSTEPSKKLERTVKEPSGHSPTFQKTIFSSEPTETAKIRAKEWLRGWAELEHSEPAFSDRQRITLRKALEAVCEVLPQSELLLELWTWDFLDDNAKACWKERVEHPYTVEA